MRVMTSGGRSVIDVARMFASVSPVRNSIRLPVSEHERWNVKEIVSGKLSDDRDHH